MIKKIYFFGLLAFISINLFSQTNYTSVNSGNWSDPLTWGAADYPGQNAVAGTITISSGHTITMDVSPANAIGALTFAINATNSALTFNTGIALTINGAITFTNPSATPTDQTITLDGGNLICSSINFANTTGATYRNIIYISIGTLTVNGNITFAGANTENYITFLDAGTLNVTGNIGGTAGTITGNTGTLNVSGNLATGTIIANTSTMNIGGNFAPTAFTANTGTIKLNGNGVQTIGSYTFYNLTIDGFSTKTATGNITVNNLLTLSNVLDMNTRILTIGTGASFAGTFSSSAMIMFSGSGALYNVSNVAANFYYTFPIGTSLGYMPLTITNVSGTDLNGTLYIRPVAGRNALLSGSNNALEAYWNISHTGLSTDITFTGSMKYPDAAIGGATESNFTTLGHFTNTWNTSETGTSYDISTNTLSFSNSPLLTSLNNDFTIGEAGAFSAPTSYYTIASGVWNSALTWNGGAIPNNTTTDVIIKHPVTQNIATVDVRNLTITAEGSLDLAGNNFTVNGTTTINGTFNDALAAGTNILIGKVTINNGGIWTTANNPPFTFRGGIINNGTMTATGTGTYTFNTNNQIIGGSLPIAFGGAVTISGAISLTNQNTSSVTITGILDGDNVSSEWINDINSTFIYAGGVNNRIPFLTSGILTASANGNTVNYNRVNAQHVFGTTYYNLVVSGGNTKTLQGNTTVNGTFTDNATSVACGIYNLYLYGTVSYTLAGTITSGINTVIYNSSSSQDIIPGTYSGSLTLQGTGNKTLKGNTIVTGAYTQDANLACGTFTNTLNGTSTLTSGTLSATTGVITFNGALNANGTNISTAANINFNNSVSYTGGTITTSAGTALYNSANAQDILPGTYTGALTLNGASIKSLKSSTTVAGAFTLATGAGGTLACGTNDLTLSGTVNNTSGVLTTGLNTVTYSGAAAQSIIGATYSGNLSISGGAKTLTNSNTLVTGALNVNASLACVALNLTLNGSVSYTSGTYTSTTGTATYNSASTQDIIAGTYTGSILMQGTGAKSLKGSTTFAGSFTQAADLSCGNFDLVLSGTQTWTSGSLTTGSNTVTYSGAAQVIKSATYNNLSLSGTADKTTGGNLRVNGILTFSNRNLILGANSLTFGTSATTSGAIATAKIDASGAGTVTKEYSAIGSFAFPIGTGALLSTATVNITSATFGGTGTVTLRCLAAKAPSQLDNTVSLVKYWEASSTNMSAIDAVLSFNYVDAEATLASEAEYVPSFYNAAVWTSGLIAGVDETANVITFNRTSASDLNGNYTSGPLYAFEPIDFYSLGGNWNTAASWSRVGYGGAASTVIPPAGSNVHIGNNATITTTAIVANSIKTLTIDATGTLDMSTFGASFTITTFDGTGKLQLNSATLPTVTTNNFITTAGSTYEFKANSAYTLPASISTYQNLIISGGLTKTLATNTVVNGNLTVTAGTLELSTFNLSVAGTTNLTSTLNDNSATGTNTLNNVNFTGGTILSNPTSLFSIGGNIDCVAAGNGTLGQGDFNITGTTTIAAGRTLTLSNAAGVKSFNDVTVSGTWTNGILTPTVINIAGNLTINTGATFTGSTAIYTFTGTGKSINGTNLLTQTITNLTTTGTVTNDLPLLSVGTLTVTNPGTFTNGTSRTATVTVGLGGTGSFIQGDNSILNLGGVAGTECTITTLTASANGNTVNYTPNAAQNVKATNYYNLTIAGGGIKTLQGATQVGNNLTISAGSLELGANNLTVSGTSNLTGNISDNSATGTNSLNNVNFTGGTIASTATALFSIGGNVDCVAAGNGILGQGDFNVTGTTTIASGRTLTLNSATGTKSFGNIIVNGTWSNTAIVTPTLINVSGDLTVNVGSTFTSGTAIYTFTGTGKTIGGTSAGFTITNATINGTYTNNSTSLTINGNLRGSGTLAQGTGSTLNINFINTGLFDLSALDATTNLNTISYNLNNVQNVRAINYYNLTIAAGNTKTLLGNIDILGDLNISGGTFDLGTIATTVNITGNTSIAGALTFNTVTAKVVSITGNLSGAGTITMGNGAIHTLNLGGATNAITTYTAPTVDQIVNYNRAGNQTVFASPNYRILNTSGSGIKSLQGVTTANRGINVNGGTLALNSNTLNAFIGINVAAGATLDVNTNATLVPGAANVPLTNSGTFKVVGLAGFPAIVNGTAANYFTISQTTAGASFAAKYYQFNYLRNGIKISNGSIDNINNFSEGAFTNCSLAQVLNLDGADLTGLPVVTNVVFNTGTVYNVRRTSGTGAITFSEATGVLAGEAFDNDDANPGTKILWTYPSRIYYSKNSGSADNTANWENLSLANPPSVLGGDLVFVIRDGHQMVLDGTVGMNVLQMQVGEGVSGRLIFGSTTAQALLIVKEALDIKTGGLVTVNSQGTTPGAHTLRLYGNMYNSGTVNLSVSSTVAVNTEIWGQSSLISGTSPSLNNLSIQANDTLVASCPLDINGNVTIGTAAVFNTGALTHTVAKTWSVALNGQLTGTGTINFDGSSFISNGGGNVIFNNLTFSGASGGGTINANTTVNGNVLITNNTQVDMSNSTLNVAGDFSVDAGSIYNPGSSAATGPTNFTGNTAQAINLTGTANFKAVTFSGTGLKTINGNMEALGLVTINSGATIAGAGNQAFSGSFRVNGTCNLSGQITLTAPDAGARYLETSNFPNVPFTLGTAKLNINSLCWLRAVAPATRCDVTVNNDVNIDYNTIALNGYLVLQANTSLTGQVGNSFNLNESPVANTFVNLYVRDANNFPAGFGTYNLHEFSRVIYDMAGAQDVRGGIVYGDLFLSGGVKTAQGLIDIRGNLYPGNTITFNGNGNNVHIKKNIQSYANPLVFTMNTQTGGTVYFDNPDLAQSIVAGTYQFNHLEFSLNNPTGSRTKSFTAASTIDIDGSFRTYNTGGSSGNNLVVDFSSNALNGALTPDSFALRNFCQFNTSHATPGANIFDLFPNKVIADSSIILYNGAAQAVADGFSYGNLAFAGSGDKTAEAPLGIRSHIYITGGNPVFQGIGRKHTIGGDWRLPTANYNPATNDTISFVASGYNQLISSNATFRNIMFENAAGEVKLNNVTINVTGDLTIKNGAYFNADLYNIYIYGNWNQVGTGKFTQTGGFVRFRGVTGNQTITSNASSYFYNFYVAKLAQQRLTVLSTLVVKNWLEIGEDIINAPATPNNPPYYGTMDITGQTLKIGGDFVIRNNSDTTFRTANSNVYFDGINADQRFYSQNYINATFNNLFLSGATSKNFWRSYDPNDTIVVLGNFTSSSDFNCNFYMYCAGNFNNTSTNNHSWPIYFNGGNQSIRSDKFNSVIFAGTAGSTKTLLNNPDIGGYLTINPNITLDANNQSFTVSSDWTNNGTFLPGTGTVTFKGTGRTNLTSGTTTGVTAGKSFYNFIENKTAEYVVLFGDLDVKNDFTITQGYFNTYSGGVYNDVFVRNNFINSGTYNTGGLSNLYLSATVPGIKTFNPGINANFSGIIINSAGSTYQLSNDFNLTYNDTLLLSAGTLDLKNKDITLIGNPQRIIIDGGTLKVDSGAVVNFTPANGQNQYLTMNSGTLNLVGTVSGLATIKKSVVSTGTMNLTLLGGNLQAKHYKFEATTGNGLIINSAVAIDATNDLSDGFFISGTAGAGTSYINFNGISYTDSINNVVFESGPLYNVQRTTAGTNDTIFFVESSGSLAGEAFDLDPTNKVVWAYPGGFYWDGGGDGTTWSDPNNWRSNSVPTISDKVILDHSFVAGVYTVRIQSADALCNKLTTMGGGAAITLILSNGYDLTVAGNIQIGVADIVTVTNNTNIINIGGGWSNDGTFNHGSGTVNFNGPSGIHIINPKGIVVGKRFYNLTVNGVSDAIYTLGGTLQTDGAVTITKGKLDVGVNDISIAGNFTVNTLNNGLFIPQTRTVTLISTTGQEISVPGDSMLYNLVFAGSGSKTIKSSLDLRFDLTINAGVNVNAGSYSISLRRNWTNNGTFTQNSFGQVNFYGTIAQTINNGVSNFNNIITTNSGAKTFTSGFLLKGDFTIAAGSGNIDFQANQITGTDTGRFSHSATSYLYLRGANNFPKSFGTYNFGQTSNVEYAYAANGNQFIGMTNGWSYGNLRLSTAATFASTKRAGRGTLVVTGSVVMNDIRTTLNMADSATNLTLTGDLALQAGGPQVVWRVGALGRNTTLTHVGGNWGISNNITNFNGLVLAGTGIKYLATGVPNPTALTITGNLVVNNGITFSLFQWYNTDNYRNIKGAGDTMRVANNANLYISYPASFDTAFPTEFAVYELASGSNTYINANNTVNQILYTGKGIEYGNLSFSNNTRTIASDGLATLDINGFFEMNDLPTFTINGRDIKVAGAYMRTNSNFNPTTNTIYLDGLSDQILFNRVANAQLLRLNNIIFSGGGLKTFSDGNDITNIEGNLTIDAGVIVQRPGNANNMTFRGRLWNNNGAFGQIANSTLVFDGTTNAIQYINSGPTDANNYFADIQFINGTSKRFITNGAKINRNFTISSNNITVYMGSFTHSIGGAIATPVPATWNWHTDSCNLVFDGAGQAINTPNTLYAVNITCSGSGTKTMYSTWNLNGDLTINNNVILDVSATNYPINLKGHWINNGTFTSRNGLVTFNGPATAGPAAINITGNTSAFWNVDFTPSSASSYTLQSATTTIQRILNVNADATLNLNSQTLALGMNALAGLKLATINGTLNINANASLRFDNNGSGCSMIVNGSLNLLGTNMTNTAKITAINSSAANRTIFTVNGNIAANYYLIEYLNSTGLNLTSTATLHATNNFSNGVWSNLNTTVNSRYLTLETDNYTGGAIDNVTFNYTGPVVLSQFNVTRETPGATKVITFSNVGGSMGSYSFEDDETVPPAPTIANATSGKLRWPGVTQTQWTGGSFSDDWYDAGNWSAGVPTALIDAYIPSTLANNPEITVGSAVCKRLVIDNGWLKLNGGNLTTSSDVNIAITNPMNGKIQVLSPLSTLTVGGSWTRGQAGQFNHGNGTVIFNSSAGSATIDPRTSDFYNITFDNISTTFLITGATLNFRGNFTILNGTVRANTANYLYYFYKNFVNQGTFDASINGTATFSGTGIEQTISDGTFDNLTISGDSLKITQNNISIRRVTTINSGATLKASAGSSITFGGNVTINAGASFHDGGETHEFFGQDWRGTGNYLTDTSTRTGTIIIERSPTAVNNRIYASKFNNLYINHNAHVVTLWGNVTIYNNLTQHVITASANNYINTQTYTINNSTGNGAYTLEDGTRLYVRGINNFPANYGFYNIGSTSLVQYDVNHPSQTIYPTDYGQLTLSNGLKVLGGDITISNLLTISATTTLDVTTSNYNISLTGNWNNGATGIFLCRQGEVSFNGIANQTITINGNGNDFYNLNVDKASGEVQTTSNLVYTVLNNLSVVNGAFNNWTRTIKVGGNLDATGGTFVLNGGRYLLNKASGSATIRSNGSQFSTLDIDSASTATYTLMDGLTVRNNLNVYNGTLNGNGQLVNSGDDSGGDVMKVLGTYKVGAGGTLALGNSTALTIEPSGIFELIGNTTSIAAVSNNQIGNPGGIPRYSFDMKGTLRANYYLFEFMDQNGVNITGTIDPAYNLSYGTFTNGVNNTNARMLAIENTQSFVNPNYITDVSFPVNPGGGAKNVKKTNNATGTVEFWNASGLFSGATFENDLFGLINWTGPKKLYWDPVVADSGWFCAANWRSEPVGPPMIPTGAEIVYIPTGTPPCVLDTSGALTANLFVQGTLIINTPFSAGDTDLVVLGDLTVTGALTLNSTNDYIAVEGSWLSSGGTVNNNGNAIFSGTSGAQTITSAQSFYNLNIGGTATYLLGAATTVRNNLTIIPGAILDVSNSNNYQLNVGGNWNNTGTFFARAGLVNFNAISGSRTISGGASAFYKVDFNTTTGTVYRLNATTSIGSTCNIALNTTLDLNGNTLNYGDNVTPNDLLTVNGGTLEIDANAILKMGATSSTTNNGSDPRSSKIFVSNNGNLKILGSSSLAPAQITRQAVSNGHFGIEINNGTIWGKYYNISYTDEFGAYIRVNGKVDATYDMSEGTFSSAKNSATSSYLWFENNLAVDDTIFNVTFNAGLGATTYNIRRTSGTNLLFVADGSGALGTELYEYDSPFVPDAFNGYIRWINPNTYIWEGDVSSDWHTPGNWSSNLVPDTSKFVIIPKITIVGRQYPTLTGAAASARKVTLQSQAAMTINGANIRMLEEMYISPLATLTVTASANPIIEVGDNWTNLGTFTCGTSKVLLKGGTGTKDIKPGVSPFYDLEVNAGATATYRLMANTTCNRNLTITSGTLNVYSGATNYNLTVGGNWNNTGGTFSSGTVTTSKVTFNGPSGTYTINPGASTFKNIEFACTSATADYRFTGNISVTNNFTMLSTNKSIVRLSNNGGTTNYNLAVSKIFTCSGGTIYGYGGQITVGDNWIINSTGTFNSGTSTVLLNLPTSGVTRTITPRYSSFYNLSLNTPGGYKLTYSTDINNNLTITNGSLDVNAATNLVYIGSVWSNYGTFIEQTGTVIFDGTAPSIFNNAGLETFYKMEAKTGVGGILTLNSNVQIDNTLTMTSGNINTGVRKLTLGKSGSAGTLTRTTGTIIGQFERYINALSPYVYPVGSATNYNALTITPTAGLTNGYLKVEFRALSPDSAGFPIDAGAGDTVVNRFTDGYWNAVANGFVATYNLALLANGFNSQPRTPDTHILKRTDNAGNWFLNGTHIPATASPTYYNIFCNAMSGISSNAAGTQFTLGFMDCRGGTIAADQSLCWNTDPSGFTSISNAVGGTNVFTYTWQYTTNAGAIPGDSNWTNIASSNNPIFDSNIPLTLNTRFIRKAVGVSCPSAKYSNILLITILPKPAPGPMYRLPNF